jgi:cardiolipin synthase
MFTIPNLLTVLRGFGAPLFLWAFLSPHGKSLALVILMFGGATDYFDGKLARVLKQESALGAKLDPAIDRLYLAVILIAFAWKSVLPIWVVALLLLRDLVLGVLMLLRKRTLPVTYLGKSATFNLLYSLPFLLLNNIWIMKVFGWSFAIWGIGLYLLTGFDYARKLVSKRD